MELNEKLITLRKKNGMTQEDLAYKLGVSRQSVSKWELAICEPDIAKLKEISKLFNISIDSLLNNGEEDSVFAGANDEKVVLIQKTGLDKKDIVLLIIFTVSILFFIGLFIYSVVNPLYYNSRYSFIWWYIIFWVSSGTWFRVFALISSAGIISSLICLLKRKSVKKSADKIRN